MNKTVLKRQLNFAVSKTRPVKPANNMGSQETKESVFLTSKWLISILVTVLFAMTGAWSVTIQSRIKDLEIDHRLNEERRIKLEASTEYTKTQLEEIKIQLDRINQKLSN